jgi:lipid A ethanolaminephosphotransferase
MPASLILGVAGMRQVKATRFPRPSLSTTTVALLVALYIAFAENRLFWRLFIARLGLNTFEHWAFLFTVGLAFALLLNVFLTLFAFRPVFKPFLIILLLTTATISYFSDTFSVVIDQSMIHNILETDVGEASELLTRQLFSHLMLFGVVPATLVALTRIHYRSRKREVLTRIGVVLGSLALFLCLGLINYKQFVLFSRENRDLRIFLNPSYPIYSLGRVIEKKCLAFATEPLQVIATDAVRPDGNPRTVVVLALGETARAREFAFNGYERDTNPQLARRGVIDFPNVQACGTSTAESLPCIFSSLERENYNRDKAGRQENLLDILQRIGVTVLWRDNNSGSKGVADRVGFEDLSRRTDPDLCASGNCFDEILLRDLDRRLAETTGDMLIVLHMKGSHGPSYYKRTPPAFKVFSPECTKDNIQDCPQQTIVNAYDNTIVYTDHVLAKLIDLLRTRDFATAMLYVSDHGESLGENGLYLHGLPYALAPSEQTNVPMIFWASDTFIKQKSLTVDALDARRKAPYSHDNIFHSVLGLFEVRSKVYRPDLDVFAPYPGQALRVASQRNETIR